MATSKSTSAKKPVATKPAAKKTTTTASKVTAKTSTASKPAAASSKPAASVKAAPGKASAPSPEQRYRMIQDAAYFIAEKNGFAGGAMDYWIAAEAEIDVMLSGKGKR